MNLAIAIGATLLLGAFYSWTGRMNSAFFFGRTVPALLAQSAAGRAITRRYQVAMLIATALSVGVAWAASHVGRSYAAIGFVLEILAFFVIFGRANGQVRSLEQESGATAEQPAVVQVALLAKPGYWVPGLGAALAPLFAGALFVLAAVLFMAHGGGFAAGWSALGANTDAHGLAALLGMGVGLLATATLTLLLFRSSARLRTRMAQYSVRASVTMQWLGAAVMAAILGCAVTGTGLSHAASKAFLIGALLVAGAVMIWNQGRARTFVPPAPELGGDDRWRWGLFYVDRNDPALFVQSRCGAGYSLNYGKVLAWPITLGVWAYVLVMLFIAHH